MKKTGYSLLAWLLVLLLALPAVHAEGTTSGTSTGTTTTTNGSVTTDTSSSSSTNDEESDDEDKSDDQDKDGQHGKKDDKEHEAKVKEAESKSDNAKKGLENAFEHAKGTPAEAILAALLAGSNVSEVAQGLKNLVDDENDDSVSGDVYGSTDAKVTDDSKDAVSIKDLTDAQKEAIKEYAKTLKDQIKLATGNTKDELKSQLAALKDLAKALDKLGDDNEALDSLKEAASLNPADISTYQQIGVLFKQLGISGTKAFVNGKEPAFDGVKPKIEKGRALVPFRAMAEALDAKVAFDVATREITVTKGNMTIKLTLNSNVAEVNGQQVQLEVAAKVENGRTLIPLRFLSEALKAEIYYDAANHIIVVNDPAVTAPATTAPTTP